MITHAFIRRYAQRVYVALQVDDDLMIKNIKTKDEAVEQLKKNGLVLKVFVSLQDYLSCEIWFLKDKKET